MKKVIKTGKKKWEITLTVFIIADVFDGIPYAIHVDQVDFVCHISERAFISHADNAVDGSVYFPLPATPKPHTLHS